MTYCVAATVEDGLVLVSDSRTHAGIDQLGNFSKMHTFTGLPGRFYTLLSAGNLATTQAVIARLERDIRDSEAASLATVGRIRDAADYVGGISREVQERYPDDEERREGFSPEADFILGGQIGDAPHGLFHIYPEGNHIAPKQLTPFVQLGEQKYGKPILDRIIRADTDLETVARCCLVSMDSTMRSDASVGPPIELMIYRAGVPGTHVHIFYEADDPYLCRLRDAWADNLQTAFDNLPPVDLPPSRVSLVGR